MHTFSGKIIIVVQRDSELSNFVLYPHLYHHLIVNSSVSQYVNTLLSPCVSLLACSQLLQQLQAQEQTSWDMEATCRESGSSTISECCMLTSE